MKTVESKRKVSEIKTGGHLVIISDMFYLRDASKALQQIDGHPAIVVRFKDGKNQIHEQTYIIDGGVKQKYFQNMLNAAQVSMKGGAPQKNEVIGKRLWIFICEVHYVNDDKVVLDHDDKPVTDYYVFKVYPYMEGVKKPHVTGDPDHNNGIPSGDFVSYKNVSDSFTKEEVNDGIKSAVKFIDDVTSVVVENGGDIPSIKQEGIGQETPSFDIDITAPDDLDNEPQF